ncbi:hypothetical protein DL765_004612 [Monosporascus sp. GIB2]|nr:hypothetical protein DL765_004612 [Monosporascus sp. GIB2]
MPQILENSLNYERVEDDTSAIDQDGGRVKADDILANSIDHKELIPDTAAVLSDRRTDSLSLVELSLTNSTGGSSASDSSMTAPLSMPQGVAKQLEPVMAPFGYISSLPSKGVRQKLINALNVWVEVPSDALTTITSIISDVHDLSLMLDDVEDNSSLRRAMPATHSVFGVPQTVNSATYQIVDVISRASDLGNPASLRAVIDEMKSLLVGQGLDLLWTHNVSVPSVEEYLQMVDGKTGGLFRMVSKLMVTQSTGPDKLGDLGWFMTLFGRFFQIRDDYANLVLDQYTMTKGFCEDLDEGKWSFVLVHAFENATPSVRTLLYSMSMQRRAAGSAAPGHKELVMKLLQESGSLEHTVQVLQELQADLMDELVAVETRIGKCNPAIRSIVDALKV